jgi:hypothetical protein
LVIRESSIAFRRHQRTAFFMRFRSILLSIPTNRWRRCAGAPGAPRQRRCAATGEGGSKRATDIVRHSPITCSDAGEPGSAHAGTPSTMPTGRSPRWEIRGRALTGCSRCHDHLSSTIKSPVIDDKAATMATRRLVLSGAPLLSPPGSVRRMAVMPGGRCKMRDGRKHERKREPA